MKHGNVLVVGLLVAIFGISQSLAAQEDEQVLRDKARKEQSKGNYKDAYDIFSSLLLEKGKDRSLLAFDLAAAVECLQSLSRIAERDEMIEKVVAKHADNWQVLRNAANAYMFGDHQGFEVAGQFHRGSHRGGGKYVNSVERDRVRALQLMEQAAAKVKTAEDSTWDRSGFFMDYARYYVGHRGYGESWRLQYLTDLAVLPDYEEGYGRYWYGGGDQRGAPVDEKGQPVLYREPADYKTAVNDGERWRWLLAEAVRIEKGRRDEADMIRADFYHNQFGTETMGHGFWRGDEDSSKEDESGPYELHLLKDTETIARFATGIKKFRLEDEFNFISIYREVADREKTGYGQNALDQLAGIYENRRQFPRAVEYWKRSIKEYDDNDVKWRKERVQDITGNWGSFQGTQTRPAGAEPSLDFVFRNGTKLQCKAQVIDVARLLSAVKAYLKSNPRELDWDRLNLSDVGYRLVMKGEDKYIGAQAAEWTVALDPKPDHFDRRIQLKVPLTKAGAYLVTAKMDDGNISRIVLWIDDTVIVRKPLDGKSGILAADSLTGVPLSGTDVTCFGYRQESVKGMVRKYEVKVEDFVEKTDNNGWALLDEKRLPNNYTWLFTVTRDDGRLAFLGFDHVWYNRQHDQEYNQRKVFAMTDRPVYRPGQTVKAKLWISQAQYDREGNSPYAGQQFALIITNPKGDKAYDKTFTADEWGGIQGEFTLARDASLGQYYAYAWKDGRSWGGGHFRVEEYKKPEFEVTVEAPTEPVMLGEKIPVTIKAKYYFGAPVTSAKIKYKVMRSSHSARWYPIGIWDWMYEPGYWWFAYDYEWYPGWKDWGFRRPFCSWWPVHSAPPELVAEGEMPITADGTCRVEIDTASTAALHGDEDHQYNVTAEVTDESRRTIVGESKVLAARKPFQVYAWVNRGHYRTGDAIQAEFNAQTLDNKPVKGDGKMRLYKVSYRDKDGRIVPVEDEVHAANLDTDEQGRARIQLQAEKAGQYRISYTVRDAKGHSIEGGYVFCVTGEGFDGKSFHFSRIEMVPEKKEYQPGEKVRLMINTEQENSTVFLFVRAANGVCPEPRVLRLNGKSTVEEIEVTKKDMPNFFIEALTVSDGKVHSEVREIVVPPEQRVVNADLKLSSDTYKPGQEATAILKLTDLTGKPVQGSAVMTVYDKSVEYIAGGSNVPEIKAFFWKWRRHHNPVTVNSLDRWSHNLLKEKERGMSTIGMFGDLFLDQNGGGMGGGDFDGFGSGMGREFSKGGRMRKMAMAPSAPASAMAGAEMDFSVKSVAMPMEMAADKADAVGNVESGEAGAAPVTVRKEFADTAFWAGDLKADANGEARVSFKMPENLTAWKTRVWVMGDGTRVGEASAEVVTVKNLLLRLQAPRFFVEKDEVVLSANVHNYLKSDKNVTAILELDGPCLEPMGQKSVKVKVDANGEKRVDWRVKVLKEGEAIVRMKALTDEESDAMEMKFPVYVHGMLKTESFCGVVRPKGDSVTFKMNVPEQRRVDQSVLEVRYSPTLAGAMVDALPYLAEYPYGCTEQTLNRFLPTVITQNILKKMGLNLKAIAEKRANLNAQEIGDDKERAKQWKRFDHDPVFDEAVLQDMVSEGIKRLADMQLSDGGWGWFSGWGEHSYAHTTAYVVHGLQVAKANGMKIPDGMIDRGAQWLEQYQADEVTKIKNWEKKKDVPKKKYADDLDAFVFMVLTDAGKKNADMRDFLYRDRKELAVYGKAMAGMAYYKLGEKEKLDMILQNIGQFVKEDDENQTAWLELDNGGYWWCWYGSENEAHAYYLKLLSLTEPKGDRASRLVKYLLNNRKHSTYWNSTRDTALCVEAMADYLKASGEDKPDMTVEVLVDGKSVKEEHITAENLFQFDNKFVLSGTAVTSGKHTVEIRRKGQGPVYVNAYLTYFTLEDYIKKAGLEVKVNRSLYKLIKTDKSVKASGSRGQAVDQKVEKYTREVIKDMQELKSGDLVEVELVIDSKNDYEYLVFEDMKAAGFEPVEVRSGYNGNEMGAYVEFRDERVCFFVRALARGKHSVTYRVRAEIPGKFSVLPTRGYAMYAPELKANSDEIKTVISDR